MGRKEIEILKVLEENSKIGDEELARMVGCSEDEVKKIIRKMEKKGIIKRYKTVIDWERAGVEYVYALVDVKVSLNRETGYDLIAGRISKFPEVQSVCLVSGDYDLSLIVRGKSMKDVASFIAEKICTLEHVQGTVTHFLLKVYKQDGVLFFEREKLRRLPVTA